MSKTFKLTLGIFLLLVVFLTYLEATEPEPVNWTPSYMPQDKIPLGSFVFFESWKNSTTAQFEEITVPPFEFLQNEEQTNSIYFFLNNAVLFDDSELNKMLNWVKQGNVLFVSANQIGFNLLDTLNLNRKTFISESDLVSKPRVNLVHPELKNENPYRFENEFEASYFSDIDSLHHLVLGTVSLEEKKPSEEKINFLKTNFGEGEILLHSTPQAFGNHFLLTRNNHEYAEKVLSYLNQDQRILWDNYYKSGKTFYSSPLYILLNNSALKWAYYFVLLGSVAFIIFEGKRKQRPVPVVEPLKNQSNEYSQSIANLYLEQNRYNELAARKIDLFLDFVRTIYRIPTESFNEEFYTEISSRSGNSLETTRDLFSRINSLKNKEIDKKEFLNLSRAINDYKNPTDGK